MRPRLRHPSPALVVALIALVVACAGTATATSVLIRGSGQVAAGAINTGDLRDGRAVRLADLTPRARFRLTEQPGPAGPEGPRGPQGPPGPRGLTGPSGANGADGSAIAFAHVNPNGVLDDARSKGVVSAAMSPPDAAAPIPARVYCLDVVPASVSNAVASIDYATTGNGVETIYPLIPGTAEGAASAIISTRCPAAQQDAAAVVVDVTGTTPETLWPERGFFIAFN
jgi:hypothetical protein